MTKALAATSSLLDSIYIHWFKFAFKMSKVPINFVAKAKRNAEGAPMRKYVAVTWDDGTRSTIKISAIVNREFQVFTEVLAKYEGKEHAAFVLAIGSKDEVNIITKQGAERKLANEIVSVKKKIEESKIALQSNAEKIEKMKNQIQAMTKSLKKANLLEAPITRVLKSSQELQQAWTSLRDEPRGDVSELELPLVSKFPSITVTGQQMRQINLTASQFKNNRSSQNSLANKLLKILYNDRDWTGCTYTSLSSDGTDRIAAIVHFLSEQFKEQFDINSFQQLIRNKAVYDKNKKR